MLVLHRPAQVFLSRCSSKFQEQTCGCLVVVPDVVLAVAVVLDVLAGTWWWSSHSQDGAS